MARDSIVVPYNDLQAAREAISEEVAAVIVEPVAANMGVVPPAPGFLPGLREACNAAAALLIFDEVITGFRLGPGGAQERFGVTPDLTCLGKVIGGGLPVGAFGGRAEIMDLLAPDGPVYQAGTLSGNPVAVAAGLAVLRALSEEPPYAVLEARAARIDEALTEAAARHGAALTVGREGSLISAFFTGAPVHDHPGARAQDTAAYARFFHAMLEHGVMLPPGAFEAWFLSVAHTDEVIDKVCAAIEASTGSAVAP